jgi:hypothetical protein
MSFLRFIRIGCITFVILVTALAIFGLGLLPGGKADVYIIRPFGLWAWALTVAFLMLLLLEDRTLAALHHLRGTCLVSGLNVIAVRNVPRS